MLCLTTGGSLKLQVEALDEKNFKNVVVHFAHVQNLEKPMGWFWKALKTNVVAGSELPVHLNSQV